ncbi:hypothetical protein ACFFRR_007425 [Megaselia abdita]
MSLDYSVICVVCLETGQLHSIYDKDEKGIQVFTKLSTCSGVNLNLFKSDYPKQICENCLTTLELSFDFMVKCRKTFSILKNSLTNKPISHISVENVDVDNDLIEDLCEYLNIPLVGGEVVEDDLLLDNVDFFSGEDYEQDNNNTVKRDLQICEVCGLQFRFACTLDEHIRKKHTNQKIFKCDKCGKDFMLNVELKKHYRIHTGQKPYSCRHCDKKFSDFSIRARHERIHTGERPYKCESCEKSFSYVHVLNTHVMNVHRKEKNFKCEKCGIGFTRKNYLTRHENVEHSGEGGGLSNTVEV